MTARWLFDDMISQLLWNVYRMIKLHFHVETSVEIRYTYESKKAQKVATLNLNDDLK